MENFGAKLRLRAELDVMYNMSNFHGKSITDLLNFLRMIGLADSMKELYNPNNPCL